MQVLVSRVVAGNAERTQIEGSFPCSLTIILFDTLFSFSAMGTLLERERSFFSIKAVNDGGQGVNHPGAALFLVGENGPGYFSRLDHWPSYQLHLEWPYPPLR